MGEYERRQRAEKAIREGEQAYRKGLSLDDNPYKISTWGMGGFWKMGWEDSKWEDGKDASNNPPRGGK